MLNTKRIKEIGASIIWVCNKIEECNQFAELNDLHKELDVLNFYLTREIEKG